jgi:hypothetical protein
MDKFHFKNSESMLHTLPGLKRISDSLIEDAQNDEPREVLLRRFGVLSENVFNMADAALQLEHTPQLMEPIVDALQALNNTTSEGYKDALKGDYENLIDKICTVQMNVITFVNCVCEAAELLNGQEDQPASPFAAYAY